MKRVLIAISVFLATSILVAIPTVVAEAISVEARPINVLGGTTEIVICGEGSSCAYPVFIESLAVTGPSEEVDEEIGTSSGLANQVLQISQPVIDLIQLDVEIPDGSIETWEKVENFDTSGPDDRVYTLNIEENGTATIRFGDGENGAIPGSGSNISAKYRSEGNVYEYWNVPINLESGEKRISFGTSALNAFDWDDGADGGANTDLEGNYVINIDGTMFPGFTVQIGITVPEFGSLYMVIILAAGGYLALTRPKKPSLTSA